MTVDSTPVYSDDEEKAFIKLDVSETIPDMSCLSWVTFLRSKIDTKLSESIGQPKSIKEGNRCHFEGRQERSESGGSRTFLHCGFSGEVSV